MCFSATASFTAGIALTAAGGAAVTYAGKKPERLFAATPLLFGVQQLTEGVVWLSFAHPALQSVATFVYVLFSHIVWPTFIPLAILLMEPSPWRRKLLSLCTAVGVVVSAYFLYFLFTEQVAPELINNCIAYVSPHFFRTFVLSPYSVATCASCLLSSHRFINVFGIFAFLSAVVAHQFFTHTFTSVWCFFAAILSIMIVLHFRSARLHSLSQ